MECKMTDVADLKLEGRVLREPVRVNGIGITVKFNLDIHNVSVAAKFRSVIDITLGDERATRAISALSVAKNHELTIYSLDREPLLKGRDLVRVHCFGKILGREVRGDPYLIEHLDESGGITAAYSSQPRGF